jgi:S-formylglutathione hydrolase FrmB
MKRVGACGIARFAPGLLRGLPQFLLPVLAFMPHVAHPQPAREDAGLAIVDERRLEARIVEVTIASEPLGGRRLKAIVIQPEGVDPGEGERPALWFLHGRNRHRASLLELPAAREKLLAAPFWVVLPDGEDGWYIDSPVLAGERYGSHLSLVIEATTRRFGLSKNPRRRAIGGWSMGGYGATRHAQATDDFGVLASVIGLLDFPRPPDLPEGRNYPVPVERFGTDEARWATLNPMGATGRLRDMSILVVTAEDAFDAVMNARFSAALSRDGIPHEYVVLPGAHTLPVVEAAVPLVLDHVATAFSRKR